jgi:tetratricopeptide (TPR) repeat protein
VVFLKQRALWLAPFILTSIACGSGEQPAAGETDAAEVPSEIAVASPEDVPLYDNLGNLHREITTVEPSAQDYFDQGLRWLYAFNHAAAARSFAVAERLDPSCAMCAWGIALALSPNINAPMDSASGVEAYAAIQRARKKATQATEAEQALIEAMAQRFEPDPLAPRPALDSAYARAMAEVADTYREDLDAQVLYADALMNLSPWEYYDEEGAPRPDTPEILARLEYVMEKDPDHPGACHLFIHAVEANEPELAVFCAERLAALMPGAGHIVHMPGHIYIRVGRYNDAIEANRHAVHADESYLEGPHVSRRGIYPQGYYPHNYHFMGFAALMAGDSETAEYAARKVSEKVGPDMARQFQWLEAITPFVYWTLVTFGQWDEVLAEPLPPPDLRFTTGMAYYARGTALAAKGRYPEAEAALDTVDAVVAAFPEGDNRTALQIAAEALAGEIALRRDDAELAVRHFRTAVELEDDLTYNEPPTWYYPVRQSLGKALLEAGRPAEAEVVYREDLERFPLNGWSLFGLEQALRAQGKTAEADEVHTEFEEAWSHADVTLVASRF